MRRLVFAAFLLLLLTPGKAQADGYVEQYPSHGYCPYYQSARYLLSLDFYAMRDEVSRRYFVAIDVFNQPSTIYSTRPVFEWANQTKIACGKAIGYMRRHWIWKPEINVESIQKCECFYDRMVQYLGRRQAGRFDK